MTAPAGYPKLRHRTVCDRTYEVSVQRRPRGPRHVLGQVVLFGTLPSMRGWKAQPAGGGEWTRKRQTRADADADLWAATCRYCAERPDGQVEHLLTLAETQDAAPALVVVPCPEHAPRNLRFKVAEIQPRRSRRRGIKRRPPPL
jgi:hypothetical protein